jgi:DNA sulfur modification protein DndC
MTNRTQQSLWGERLTLEHAVELTIESLRTYGPSYRHWACAFSGGKDSTATATVLAHLLKSSAIPAPESLTVLYADTRMELPPLQACAITILRELQQCGIRTQIVFPALDDRMFVYMFGRGVPAPKNRFRWCTSQLKIEPMELALAALREQHKEKFLMLTGVRIGESVARDQHIAMSCSRDGAECGQGWFQSATPESVADVLAPLLHWRVCNVWDWLTFHAHKAGFSTQLVAEAYGGNEAEEINARTGCVGCNLAQEDTALDTILRLPSWSHLAPLKRLRPLYQELKKPQYRLRKNGERRKDGSLSSNPMRMGPYTMEARLCGLEQVLAIQRDVNESAYLLGRPKIDLISLEEYTRILQLINMNTWPDKWTGHEPNGAEMLPQVLPHGMLQPLLEAV